MAIEFPCSQCGKQLRVQEESAGKQARCPHCGAISQIPMAAPAPAMAGADDWSSFNPYASPTATGGPISRVAAPGEIIPTRTSVGRVLGATLRIFISRLGFCFLFSIALIGIGVAAAIAAGIVFGGIRFIFLGGGGGVAEFLILGLLAYIGAYVFFTWLQLGSQRCFLNVARGRLASIGDIFSGGPFLLRGLGIQFVFLVIAIAFAIPAALVKDPTANAIVQIVSAITQLIVSLYLFQAFLLLVDQNLSVGESFSTSVRIMEGNKLTLFLIYLIFIPVVIFLAVIAALIVAAVGPFGMLLLAIAAIPLISLGILLTAVFYLQITGQATADAKTSVPHSQDEVAFQ